jgi:membrane protein required for colicin V production
MNAADYIILGALAISLLFGMVRGFMREAISLLAWLGGLWLAWRFADDVKPLLGGLLADEPQRTWAARTLILMCVVFCSWILAETLSYFVNHSGLSLTVDRVLGMFCGLLRGLVLVSLLVMVGTLVGLHEMRWWQKSELLPHAESVSQWLGGFADTALASATESK